MAEKRSKENNSEKHPLSTVQHESSASNAQDLGLDRTLETKKEMRNASTHRRGHSGSDGADQERGSNH